MFRRATLLVAAAGVVAALIPATASANAVSTPFASGAKTLHLQLKVNRFVSRQGHIAAAGTANAVLTDPVTGARTVVRQHVTFTVRRGATCRILLLQLDQLDLTLLGLNVHLDKVVLSVTGQRNGGVLGSLFCSLAGRRVSASSAARSLNAGLRRAPIAPMGFTTRVSPTAQASQAPTTCPVLDLTLGPLHLELLGLVVDLNRVHLTITAIRGGGILGDLFCGLSTRTP